jgi:predicted  nucleic acid-binding Zn-ribbon protein
MSPKDSAPLVDWSCLRCGHRYKDPYDPKAPLVERQCPRCRSNSVRRTRGEAGASSPAAG